MLSGIVLVVATLALLNRARGNHLAPAAGRDRPAEMAAFVMVPPLDVRSSRPEDHLPAAWANSSATRFRSSIVTPLPPAS